jgi:hypothetical protein
MKAYGGMDVYIHIFLTSALAGCEWSALRPGRFTPGEIAPGTQWIVGWVDPRGGLDDLEKRKFLTLPGLELRPLSRPARSYLYTDYATYDFIPVVPNGTKGSCEASPPFLLIWQCLNLSPRLSRLCYFLFYS